jgi:hypothetical protein
MFASKTLVEHLLRGFVGIAALALAAFVATGHPFVALAMLPVALVALRGCPMCWTMGLIDTIRGALRRPRPGEQRRALSPTRRD